MKNKAVSLCLVIALAACGPDRVAGGNGTSTDNVLTARILSIDSLASLVPPGDTNDYPLFVQLDSGSIDFDKSHPDGRDLRVAYDSQPLAFQLREWNTTERFGNFWVRIPKSLRNSGAKLEIHIGRDSVTPRADSSATWKGIPDSVRQKVTTILLADFESGSKTLDLPCKCNEWYVAKSGYAVIDSLKTGIEAAGAGRAGKAFHLSYSAIDPEWTIFGSRMGTRYTYRFGKLDSVTFWARGTGIFRLALENRFDPYNLTKAWKVFYAQTGWTRYTVRPAEFEPWSSFSYGWDIVKSQVNTITFFGQNGTDLWVDDVRLHGLSPAELQ